MLNLFCKFYRFIFKIRITLNIFIFFDRYLKLHNKHQEYSKSDMKEKKYLKSFGSPHNISPRKKLIKCS